jgi:NAD(P)-dependent dehydrogenase (short-subunit alcohol dehydrogenase family)
VNYSIAGKTVLVTGAGGGIGRAAAEVLHDHGANVLLADLNTNAVQAAAADLDPARTLAIGVDVTDRSRLDAVVAAAVDRFGGLDIVFANAGIAVNPPATIASVDEREFERVLEVNLVGVWRTVRASLPEVIARRGHILVTASVYAYANGTANAAYAMSKAGVEQFGRALRTELAPHGATAGVLYPGWVNTAIAQVAFDGHATATELVRRAYPKPLRKLITPESIGPAIVKGIERRSPRVTVPRRWVPISLMRGVVNAITDHRLERDPEFGKLVLEIERQGHTRGKPEIG